MAEHTPTPWAADPDDREGMEWNVHIVEASRPHMRIAFTSNGPDSEANAAFIVKAVNNHEALVNALHLLVEKHGGLGVSPEIVQAKAVLQAVVGQAGERS